MKKASLILILTALISACQSLPQTPHLADSIELTHAVYEKHATLNVDKQIDNELTFVVGEQTQVHPNLSGYYPISTGANAFAARSIMSRMATHSIDVQYYIWHDDEAGQLMLKDLWEAAERGVMVRVLLDDFNGNKDLDQLLVHFASHPNIAVRLTNPMTYRKFRFVNYLTNPIRTNTRMHNKSMTFDNHLSVIGGRNIGNEYLNNDQSNQFADLDVLLIGEVVPKVTDSFNEYWDSLFAYDIETLVKPVSEHLSDFSQSLILLDNDAKNGANDESQALMTYRDALVASTIGQDLLNKQIPFRWANIEFLADPASKLGGNGVEADYLVHQLRSRLGVPKEQFSLISSYFVPTKEGVDTLIALAKSGVDVRILTNSYDATDVGVVHAGYAHWRKDLLANGVRIFELKSTAKNNATENNKLWRTPNQTTTSLHAKAFAVDGHQVFIGSYNVDPRSANINTEMGVIISDNRLADRLHSALGDNLLTQAYEVKLNNNKLEWHTLNDGKIAILNQEPNMQISDRFAIVLMGFLPIDWLL